MSTAGAAGAGGRRRGRPWAWFLGVLATGLVVHLTVHGWVGDRLGDVLYAAMVLLGLRLLAPRAPDGATLALTIGWCFAVELLQLTGLPAAAGRRLPVLRLVLGTGYDTVDLAMYVVGALAAALLLRARRSGGAVDRR